MRLKDVYDKAYLVDHLIKLLTRNNNIMWHDISPGAQAPNIINVIVEIPKGSLMTNPTYPGILLEARPIALLKMKDAHKADDKILCVAIHDPRYASYNTVSIINELLIVYVPILTNSQVPNLTGASNLPKIEQCQEDIGVIA